MPPMKTCGPSPTSITRIAAPPGSTPRKSERPVVTARPRSPWTRRGKKPFTLVCRWNIRLRPTMSLELPSAPARGFDRARREHEGVGHGPLHVAVAVDVVDGAHVAAVVDEPDHLRLVAELAAARQQRAPQGRHRRRALRIVRAAEPAAEPAVDARRPVV